MLPKPENRTFQICHREKISASAFDDMQSVHSAAARKSMNGTAGGSDVSGKSHPATAHAPTTASASHPQAGISEREKPPVIWGETIPGTPDPPCEVPLCAADSAATAAA